MKKLVTFVILLFDLAAAAQSPGLTINLRMDPDKARAIHYKISMKICEPRKMTNRGGLFAHDTSAIDFTSLKAGDINCDDYFDNGMPTLISGEEEDRPFNQFKFSNQVFAWEKIFVFRISDTTSKTRQTDMYIVIPMKYKSFRTTIDIKGIVFQPGKVIFLTSLKGKYSDEKLSFKRSLKKIKGVDIKGFVLKGIL
jgi:hypothetical protein